MKRDHRTDPREGDVLENGVRRRVVLVELGAVTYELPDLPDEGLKRVLWSSWRIWARNAVLREFVVPVDLQGDLFEDVA